MPCVVCKFNDTPYKCASCGNPVCKNHARNVDNKALCLNCVANAQKKPESGVSKAFSKVLVLFIAAAIVYFLGDWYIANALTGASLPPEVLGMVAGFKSLGLMILLALGTVSVMLFILSKLFR